MLRNSHQLPPPPDAPVPKVAMWNSFRPHLVIVAMDKETVAAKLMLRNVETNFGVFSPQEMERIRQRRFDQLLVLRGVRRVSPNLEDGSQHQRRII